MTLTEIEFPSSSLAKVADPRKPGGKKWRLGRWVKHLRYHEMMNMRSLEQGGFPYVYQHWLSLTQAQKDFLLTLDEFDHYSFFNVFFFTHDSDAIQFKLMGE